MNILFVCLGNICRSPTAEGVMRQRLEQAGLAAQVALDSAGTAAWHQGKPVDPRTRLAAQRRGYDLSLLRGRQVVVDGALRTVAGPLWTNPPLESPFDREGGRHECI